MKIRHIEMAAHPGGLTKLTVVVEGDRSDIAKKIYSIRSSRAEFDVDIKKIVKHRSLNANAYYWSLLEEMSMILGTSKEELHENQLREYGTMLRREDGKLVAFSLLDGIDPHLVARYVTVIGEAWVKDKKFIHYAILKGSSEMNSAEFSHLLDMTIQDCKELGIETLPDEDIRRMKELLNDKSIYSA